MSRDPHAAQEMVNRSGQMGVPVIIVDDAVVVGFDQPRLEQLLAARAGEFHLGATVARVSGGGLLVGHVRAGSAAAHANLQPGDVILEVSGQPVGDADQLKARLELATGSGVRLKIKRGGSIAELRVQTG